MAYKWTDSAIATATSVAGEDLLLTVDDPGGTPISKKITVANFMGSDAVLEILRDHFADSFIVGGNNVTVTHNDVGNTFTIDVDTFDGVVGGTTPAAGTFTTLTATGAATLQSTLGVTGAATFSSTVGVTGDATFGSGTGTNLITISGSASSTSVNELLFYGGGTGNPSAKIQHSSSAKTLSFLTGDFASLALRYEIDASGHHDFQAGNITTTGTLASGAATFTGVADIVSGGLSLTIGADSGLTTRTNATTKIGRIVSAHYTNAEQPVAFGVITADASNNVVAVGGGSSLANAATIMRFYTAANSITTTGSVRYEIDASGNHDFQAGNITTTGTLASGAATISGSITGSTGGAFNIRNAIDTAEVSVYGGTSSNGANVNLYGSTHPTTANTGRLRIGTGTTVLEWTSTGATVTGTLSVSSVANGAFTFGGLTTKPYEMSVPRAFQIGWVEDGVGGRANIECDASNDLYIKALSGNTYLWSGGTTALTLDSSQNATFAGNATVTGDLTVNSGKIYVGNDQGIYQNTPDGSDAGRTELAGGGDIGSTRGGFILLSGNEEVSNGGRVYIEAGGGADQNIYLASNTTVTGTLDVSGNTILGSTSVTPDGTLHVHTATAGAVTAAAGADDIVVENSAEAGITVLTPDANVGYLIFGSPTDATGAWVSWQHSALTFKAGPQIAGASTILTSGNGTTALTLDSSQNATFAGDVTLSAGGIDFAGSSATAAGSYGIGSVSGALEVSSAGGIILRSDNDNNGAPNALQIIPNGTSGGSSVFTVAESGATTIAADVTLSAGDLTVSDGVAVVDSNAVGNVDVLSLNALYSATGQGPALKFLRNNNVISRIRGIDTGSWDGGIAFEVIDTAALPPGASASTVEAARFDQFGNLLLGATSTSNNAQFYATKTYNNASGNDFGAYLNYVQSAATTGQLRGLVIQASATHTSGTVASLYGQRINTYGSGASGTTTNLYGIYVQTGATNALATVTNAYSVYVSNKDRTGTITNDWALYSADTAASYLAGDLRIGTTSATSHAEEALRVQGSSTRVLNVHRSSAASSWVHFTNTSTGTTNLAGFGVGIDDNNNGIFVNYESTALRFLTANTERFRVASDAYALGIGTTDVESWSSSYSAIEFGESAIMGENAGPSLRLLSNAYFDGSWKYKSGGPSANQVLNDGYFYWQTATSGSADAALTWSEKMRLTNDGELLLGATATSSNAQFYATKTDYANASTTYGAFHKYTSSGTGTMRGMQVEARYNGSGTTGELLSLRAYTEVDSAAGTVTAAYGLKVAVHNINTGTITTGYGLYVDSFLNSGGGSYANRWGIYQVGASDNNYLAGDLRIGTTSATSHAKESLRVFNSVDDARVLANFHNDSTGANAQSLVHITTGDTGTAITDGVLFGLNASNQAVLYNLESTAMVFATANTERFRVASDAYALGIGTTDVESWNSSYAAVQLKGASLMGTDGQLYVQDNAYFDGSWKRRTAAAVAMYQQVAGVHSWMTNGSSTADSVFTPSEKMRLNNTGQLLVGDTGNANMTVGLTINGGANDDEHFALKNSDVSHGYTTGAETDTFFTIAKSSANGGGANVRFYGEDAAITAIADIHAYGGTASATKSTAGIGLINLYAAEHDGANALSDIAADGNVFSIRGRVGAANRTLFIIDEDGDYHYDGADGGAFDTYHDAHLVRAFANATSKHTLRTAHDDWVQYNEDTLVEIGVLGAPVSEGGLINGAQLQRVHTGAIWQNYMAISDTKDEVETLRSELADTKSRLAIAESKLKQLPQANA